MTSHRNLFSQISNMWEMSTGALDCHKHSVTGRKPGRRNSAWYFRKGFKNKGSSSKERLFGKMMCPKWTAGKTGTGCGWKEWVRVKKPAEIRQCPGYHGPI